MCARSKYQGKGQLIASFCGIQLLVPAPDTCLWRIRPMVTSSNGNIFRVTGPLCAGNPPVTGELPSQRPMTQSFDVFFDLGLNKRCSKQSKRRWFETPHYDVVVMLNCPPSMHAITKLPFRWSHHTHWVSTLPSFDIMLIRRLNNQSIK